MIILRSTPFQALMTVLAGAILAANAWAKIPVPAATDESKAKEAEAAAKTAHGNAVANFQLCKSMDAVAAHHARTAKAAGKDLKPATPTPPCADPGAFVYPPPPPGTVASVAAAPAKPGAPTAATAPAKASAAGAKPATPAAPPKKS